MNTQGEQQMDNIALSRRPQNVRSVTEPSPTVLLQSYFMNTSNKPLAASSRTRSPFQRSHMRSRSSGSALAAAPVMVRAHSMPAVHSTSQVFDSENATLFSTQSPQRSPARARSPLVADSQDASQHPPRSPRWFELSNGAPIESIQEDSELDLTPRSTTALPLLAAPSASMRSASAPLRRRPASPLHSATSPSPASTPTSHPAAADASGSPVLGPSRYNEALPTSFPLHHFPSNSSFSSMSSTPSSARSRSPSISSLGTIEDEPDAESEALEADRLWKLSLGEKADRGEDGLDESYKRRGFGHGRGRNAERKRWSVCGGERRADLDLETIWED